MRKSVGTLFVCFVLAIGGAQAQTCVFCQSFNCAFDGITGQCLVNCKSNFTYSVGGTITSAPSIIGGSLINFTGNQFTVKWDCVPQGNAGATGSIEVHYTASGQNRIAEGQVCLCGVPPDYCDTVNLNCAADGITGPCNMTVGNSATYSVAPSGSVQWLVTINGSTTTYTGNPVSLYWGGPGPYTASIEVKVNGATFTEGMVCVDIN